MYSLEDIRDLIRDYLVIGRIYKYKDQVGDQRGRETFKVKRILCLEKGKRFATFKVLPDGYNESILYQDLYKSLMDEKENTNVFEQDEI